MISLEEIKKLAFLARIELSAHEAKELQKGLGTILDYVSILKKAETPDVGEETSDVGSGPINVFRDDEPISDESEIKKGEHTRVKHIL